MNSLSDNKSARAKYTRHSFANHLLEKVVYLKHIQSLLDYAKPKTTELYTKISTSYISKIQNLIDILVIYFFYLTLK
ncbi:MAG: tyrosine-type recombinase/integrase [Bacteroidetes bacterium]|nr:tyrosine-type recombinase/integrase [Bacteroidota bacterium]